MELGESLVPAGPGEMGLGESISHLMGREGSFDEKIDAARYYKAAGNALLNSGDYEDALRKYEAGLKLVTFHERAMAMVKLPPADLEAIAAVRVPLLLNAVLCELRMNPEEGNGRLETAEERIADVLMRLRRRIPRRSSAARSCTGARASTRRRR